MPLSINLEPHFSEATLIISRFGLLIACVPRNSSILHAGRQGVSGGMAAGSSGAVTSSLINIGGWEKNPPTSTKRGGNDAVHRVIQRCIIQR